MKKSLIAASIIAAALLTGNAEARGHRGFGGTQSWLIPSVVTGLVVYAATRPDTVVVQPVPQPMVVLPPVEQTIVTTQEPLYKKVIVYDPSCFCNKQIYVQIAKEIK